MKGTLPLIAAFLQIGLLAQQSIDTTKPTVLKEVTVTGIKTVRGTGICRRRKMDYLCREKE
jgi:hypothetical protein